MGINWNFAPVVDVNHAGNFIGNKGRTFSENARIVSTQAQAWIVGHHQYNIATTIKHFPGHGSSTQDTHEGYADISETWSADELLPFELLSPDRTDAFMTAHVFLRDATLENGVHLHEDTYPVSLSPVMTRELIRNQLGFTGKIITDDLCMGSIAQHYSLPRACELALKAGADILLIGHEITIDGVNKRVEHGVTYEQIRAVYEHLSRFNEEL